MKHSGALVTALWSCARQFLEPGSLAMCPSTIQGRLTSHSSHQEYKNDRWQCLAEHRQRPSSAKAGTVAQPSIYANVYHPPSNSRNDRHLQMRAIQHRAALAQTSTESREAQGSSASSKEEHPGVPQPASPAPAGTHGCRIPGPRRGFCRRYRPLRIMPLCESLMWPMQGYCCPLARVLAHVLAHAETLGSLLT